MNWRPTAWPRSRIIFSLLCVAAIAYEGYVVFVMRDFTFSITGRTRYEISEFNSRKTVWQAFFMRGENMHSLSVRLSADTAASVRLGWILFRGSPDQIEMVRAFDGEKSVTLRAGRHWVTIEVPRDGSSHDRWYTFEVRLLEAAATAGSGGAARPPQISILATHDNPDRGGVLWVDGVRQTGSLFMHARRRGKTLYARFRAEADPHLPPVLRIRAVQWIVFIALHWAMIVFAYTVVAAAKNPRLRTSP